MKRGTLNLADLSLEQRRDVVKQLGRKRAPRRTTFPKNRARTCAIRVLAVVAHLSPTERGRVLAIAARMNNV